MSSSSQQDDGGGNFFMPKFLQFKEYTTSMWVISAVAFVMAMDFMIVYISIFDYWVVELSKPPHMTPTAPSGPAVPVPSLPSPPPTPAHPSAWAVGSPAAVSHFHESAAKASKTYGFAFGCYDLAQMVLIPGIAWTADMFGYKPVLLLTVAFNLIGNVLYSLAIVPHSRAMFLAGRMLAGLGSANLVLFQSFMVLVSTRAGRGDAMIRYRTISFFGRFAGPLIGWALIYVNPSKPVTALKLSGMTLPGWVMAICDVILIIAVLVAFKDPLRDDSVRKEKMAEADSMTFFQYISSHRSLLLDIIKSQAVWLCGVFSFWLFYAQVLPLYILRFHTDAQSAAFTYTWIGIGFVAGLFINRRAKKLGLNDMGILLLGLMVLLVGLALLNDWWPGFKNHASECAKLSLKDDCKGDNICQWHKDDDDLHGGRCDPKIPGLHKVIYDIGIGTLCAGFSLFSTCAVAVYSMVVEGVPFMTSFMAISVMIGSGCRFAGPTVSSFFLGIQCDTPPAGVHVGVKSALMFCHTTHDIVMTIVGGVLVAIALVVGFVFLKPLYDTKMLEADTAEREPINADAA